MRKKDSFLLSSGFVQRRYIARCPQRSAVWRASLLFLILSVGSYAQESPKAQEARDTELLQTIDANSNGQLAFLETLVNQNSGTLNVSGVRAVGALFEREFETLGYTTRWIEMPAEMNRAGHFVATRRYGRGPHLLLIGHLDTVFEANSPFQRFERDGDLIRGPGINDMKGGDAVILYALKALQSVGAIRRGRITVFLTGDEEAPGSPLSVARRDLIAAGKAADVALNFEGGSAQWAVIGRRGSSSWQLQTTGKRAHSSGVFSDQTGAGAVFELARILNRFYGEVRGPFGLTFNPGVIAGGTFVEPTETPREYRAFGKTNVVAQTARAEGGLRFMNDAQLQDARRRMRQIVEDHLPNTGAEIIFKDSYPAMEVTDANRALLERLNAVHTRLGLPPAKAFPPERRGAADISFIAPYVTSMDGLGVDGKGAHSLEEVMYLPSLQQATQRSALLIADLMNAAP